MFGKGDSSNRQKMNGCTFQEVLGQNSTWFILTKENALFEDLF